MAMPKKRGFMAHNLRHDMRSAVLRNFREGIDKHADRKSEAREEKVYSYTSRNNYLDKINAFCKYAKEQEGVTKTTDLSAQVVARYLDHLGGNGATQKTLDTVRSDLAKVGRLMGIDLRVDRAIAIQGHEHAMDRGATDTISRDDYLKLLEYARSHPSGSGTCILLERELGVRVGDICYGLREKDENTLLIRCKHGKMLERPITPLVREVMRSSQYRDMVDVSGKFHAPKDSSVNTYLRRTEDKLGLQRHSFHSLRRFCVQEKYDEYRNAGATRTEALGKASAWLNPGEDRERMMMQSYIANAW